MHATCLTNFSLDLITPTKLGEQYKLCSFS
jgi:hypothetical protein